MNLASLASARAEAGRPVRVALIGAGKFGSMFLSQVPTIPGLEVAAIADLDPEKARAACREVGWDEARIAATLFTDDAVSALDRGIEVMVEATGHPEAGISHALAAIEAGLHVVMVNVEADVLAGPVLAEKAGEKGVVYSMAYGDQPALVAEMVDWARATGFTVAAAGKGTKYLPHYHQVTPDDVWSHYGLTPEQAADAGMNPQMFNSFLDGTKSALEMAAIANACGLDVPEHGLGFPPCGVDDLAHVLRPRAIGGCLERDGMVEVVSSLERDGRPVFRDLRWGVYVVLKAPNDYAASCFRQYGLPTDVTGRYAAMYKPFHLIGMELSISILSAALRGEPTGTTREWRGDVAAVAKRDLDTGETLDGEGGYTVYGRLSPASESARARLLPIGLAHGVRLARPVAAGQALSMDDVDLDSTRHAVRLRGEMIARAVPDAQPMRQES
ncbi:NAD(P)H-dependent oxidoreductase [Jannaschia seohaensis]|uniref:Predicted homoserine dehydrogenase, contains C-terminal SAF domain n=1 Tax=Jannaschia seohaensis TaxID=475081 RepID=A0A2Y9AZW4_9RHOB|nr:Gfo/Idh/MocA family oxidoreductase [Jannaschia seohaensis]PWJ16949.1 putative homoserine dehydrogenase-like protein [Jannaschia seohaensis]SSA48177.1 Predicted homoserine dehydrogenase, contains C-terminal SAF domain [Jannaschia seohaensis]